MPLDSDQFDFFVSYARNDNARWGGAVGEGSITIPPTAWKPCGSVIFSPVMTVTANFSRDRRHESGGHREAFSLRIQQGGHCLRPKNFSVSNRRAVKAQHIGGGLGWL